MQRQYKGSTNMRRWVITIIVFYAAFVLLLLLAVGGVLLDVASVALRWNARRGTGAAVVPVG